MKRELVGTSWHTHLDMADTVLYPKVEGSLPSGPTIKSLCTVPEVVTR
jgi:hypothetical protein